MRPQIVAALLCLALVACGHRAPQSHFARMQFTFKPTPVPTAYYQTYPLADALSGRGPKLTRAQRNWAEHVARSPVYRGEAARLRFTTDEHGFKTPLVMYIDKARLGEADRGGHVIGEACNVYFDPVRFGVTVGTSAGCPR